MELKLQTPTTLKELASKIGADLAESVGAVDSILLTNVSALDTANAGSISFLTDNPAYLKYLSTTKASAVLTSSKHAAHSPVPVIIAKNARLALGKLLQLCIPVSEQNQQENKPNIHPTAVLGRNVQLGNAVTIGPYCVIGDNCTIGDNTELKAHVNVYANTKLGAYCTIHSGTVLGSDGFGYEIDEQGDWFKMPHLGGLVIGDHVEIGSNTSIDRGMIDNTVIGSWVIIDNLVQIGHNVTIGDHTAIAGCAGVAGSTTIGKRCLIGGAACIAGHIVLGDRVYITGTSAVNHSILEPGIYSSGLPARENSVWRRNVARFNQIEAMAKRVRALEKVMRADLQSGESSNNNISESSKND